MNLYQVIYETVYSISNEDEYVVAASFEDAENLIKENDGLVIFVWSINLICTDIKIQEKTK